MSRNAFLAHNIALYLGVNPGNKKYDVLVTDLRLLNVETLHLLWCSMKSYRTCDSCGEKDTEVTLCKECAL